MSTRPTFEDRLLAELKREIESRREETAPAAPPRRLVTPRRFAVVALACALLGLTPVVAPGSPAPSSAYAVEGNGDGTVKLTVKNQFISVEAQQALARVLRPWEIHVTIDVLPPGYVCERSKPSVPGAAIDRQGDLVPVIPSKAGRDYKLSRGDVLAFENSAGSSRARAIEVYRAGTEAVPCVPLKLTLPDHMRPK